MWYTRPYSWISVNVGLDTSSTAAAPSALTLPFASVVFPAPRFPISRTTARQGSSAAIRRPSSTVSSSERVSKTLVSNTLASNTLMDRPRKIVQQVRRNHALLGEFLGRDLPRPPVEPDRRAHCGPDIARKLGDETCDQARQDVARPALGHGRRTRGINPHKPIRKSDQRAMSLQYQTHVPGFRKFARRLQAIGDFRPR